MDNKDLTKMEFITLEVLSDLLMGTEVVTNDFSGNVKFNQEVLDGLIASSAKAASLVIKEAAKYEKEILND